MIERLTVMGAGTILPVPGYGCSGYLVWAGSEGDRPLLMDCGPGTLDRLAELEVAVEEIELILVSHLHVDHVSDLAAVLLSRWIKNLGREGDPHRIAFVGPVGLADYLATVSTLNQPWIADYTFDITELAAGRYEALGDSPFAGLTVSSLPTGHTENSIAFRLSDESGRVLFYSGDTDYNEELLPLAAGADLALMECSMPDEEKLPGHLTPRLVGRLAAKAEVRRLLLTHFYPAILGTEIAQEVGREYGGSVMLAQRFADYTLA